MRLAALTDAVQMLRVRVGDPGDPWCDRVESLFMELMARWGVGSTGEPALGGYGGICLPVAGVHGPGMLKISRSHASRDLENEVLARWDGLCAVRLHARDDGLHARLLERLPGPPLATLPDAATAMSIAGDLARQLAVVAPPGIPRMVDIAASVAAVIASGAGSQNPGLMPRDLQAAADTYRGLGVSQPATLIHGDLHGSNILGNGDRGWSVIDPLGVVGSPALEALTMLRDRWMELPQANRPNAELHQRLNEFADAAEVPRQHVLAWTHARCVRAVIEGVTDDNGLHAWTARQLAPSL